MKSIFFKSILFLLLGAFTLSSTPALASASVSSASQYVRSDVGTTTVKKKTQKRGFFSKVKQFGKKASAFVKGLASGEHSAVVAILLAFFLGFLGVHRVYLGGRPILILFYIITFGGIFGILPLIDFIRLIIGHMDHYEGNDKFLAAFS